MDTFSLNPEQAQAVETLQGPLLILAGAGTGKTKVLCSRVVNLIDHGVDPQSILAVTFTNKAAREMRARIKGMRPNLSSYPLIGTFHAFCLRVLKKYHKNIGLGADFKIISSSDQVDFVRRTLDEKGLLGEVRAEFVHSKISLAKNKLLTTEDVYNMVVDGADTLSGFSSRTIAELYDMYERQLKINNVIDFDDCIFKTVELLKNNPDVQKKVSDTYQYILVDEFQDTNYAQLTLVKYLATHTNICVVGDDDQSIYGFRGAMASTFLKFQQIFPNTKIIKLEQNYRCSNKILELANTVIANNKERLGKKLWSSSQEQTPIKVLAFNDIEEEASFIAKSCISFIEKGMKYQDIAVLYRTNSQSKDLELAMREYNLRYKVFGGQSFFERKEVKDFLCYLYLIVNPDDKMAFWRVVNIPSRGIGLKTLEKISECSRRLKKSPFAVCRDHDISFSSSVTEELDQFIKSINHYHDSCDFKDIDSIESMCKALIQTFRLDLEIKLKTKDDKSVQKKLINLHRLPEWIRSLCVSFMEENQSLNLKEVLDYLTLSDVEEKEEDSRNYISLMTVHSAKGLEFPVVFLSGMEQDVFPHKNSYTEKDGIGEERRLFYVAITRAKKHLFITRSKTKKHGKEKFYVKGSMFLKEMPPELIVSSIEEEKKTETERKQRLSSRLCALRTELLKN